MDSMKLGNDLFRYGTILEDKTFYKNGWKRITIIKYEQSIYLVKMNGGIYEKIKEI